MPQDESPLLARSDKSFWHGYLDFYGAHLPKDIRGLIVEFGVFKGHSIQWLLHTYPAAQIIGVDILPVQPEWPTGSRVTYRQLDQGSEDQVRSFFDGIRPPALILDDGSHVPAHQSRCLKHGFNRLKPGGMYILEDIHTSHPAHPLHQREFHANRAIRWLSGVLPSRKAARPDHQTALTLLLALEHIRRSGRDRLSDRERAVLSAGTHFTEADVLRLHAQIQAIHVYKRATLPAACYACGATSFDYHRLKCGCGVDLLGEADSMSVLIVKNGSDSVEMKPAGT
ncbi:MAG TPA: hypothetical protein PLJ99_00090 [Kiritimatiellia bacterium]|nr:hypothetical protein [Kiritimatiellia bacterium]HPR67669.1 hypothetical protein [Kiritimatiellia bacterium]